MGCDVVWRKILPPTHPHTHHLSLSPSVLSSVSLLPSACLSFCLSVCLCLSLFLFVCLRLCLYPLCLLVCLSLFAYLCLSVSPSVSVPLLSLSLSVRDRRLSNYYRPTQNVVLPLLASSSKTQVSFLITLAKIFLLPIFAANNSDLRCHFSSD